jgi:signal transduction histidine kinase
MNNSISCPRCGEPNDLKASNCEHCGVNLALSAILVEQKLKGQTDLINELKLSPEVLVPRLGDYLIERKLLSSDDLTKALEYQREMNDAGQEKLIGQALLDLNLISREMLDQIVTEQILQLQSALRDANDELENRVRQRTSELEDALTRLSELSQLKSNFIANISHELRTPLTHIKGYIELLGEGALGDMNSQQVDAIQVMQKAESRLGSLIEDLIQFSAYSKGGMEIYLESINLTEMFNRVVSEAQQRCKEKGLTCQTKIPAELPGVMADPQRLPWVMNQLVDNAVKFTPAGGMIQIGAKTNDHRVQLYVFDTGIGIAEHRLDEIFEPFHQLDGSSTRRYGGTGLGLSMARQIVEAHSSQFIVRSKEGEGSYFEFSLIVNLNTS